MSGLLTAAEVERLVAAPSSAARTAGAAAGGGGRRRRGPRSARPRLNRRERRCVNDALLRAGPDADAKREFDVRARAPTPFAALRDLRDLRDAPVATTVAVPRAGRRVRALVRTKGARVRRALRAIEAVVREVRPGEQVTLRLPDAQSRWLAHCVAQFYGFMHRSEGKGSDRVLYVASPQAPRAKPPVRLVDVLV